MKSVAKTGVIQLRVLQTKPSFRGWSQMAIKLAHTRMLRPEIYSLLYRFTNLHPGGPMRLWTLSLPRVSRVK